MAPIDRVIARLIAGGMSAAQAAAVAGTIASAGYDLAERTTSAPATASSERATFVRAVGGRTGASIHAVLAGTVGWMAWVELRTSGGGVHRLTPVFVPRTAAVTGDDPFVVS
jgi:hypothetical protein